MTGRFIPSLIPTAPMPDARSPETSPDETQSATATDVDTATATAEAPAPEPWTAAKVVEWNSYYDIYVVLAVLLITFLGSTNLLTSSSVWTHLRAGQALTERFDPTADPFSYSEPGHRWIHIPWLSDLVHYQVYNFVAGFAPPDATPPPAPAPGAAEAAPVSSPSAEQWGIAGITVMDALVRAITLLVLLSIRHRGPGLWWAALCGAVALAVLPIPFLVPGHPLAISIGGLGGLGGSTVPGSWQWGLLFLTIELFLIFQALERGRVRALYGLVPLFLLWVNVDESFFYGLVLLAASEIGLAVAPRSPKGGDVDRRTAVRTGLIVLAACAAICLANPSFYKVYPAAVGSILPIRAWAPGPLTELDTSIFSPLIAGKPTEDDGSILLFGVLAGIGYLSFILNARRFSLPRFLIYTAAVVFWALVRRYVLEFAPVFAVVMVLNGQEWYQDRFGTEGRLGRGWALWSTGGRAATLAALGTILVFRVVLGWWTIPGEPQFGLGFREGEFAFEAADLLRDAPIEGNVFNMWLKEGDALIWRAYPRRKVFIDSRRHLYGPEVVSKYVALRGALRDDDVAAWKPLLDEYGVSAVMIDTVIARNTYQSLSLSRNWIRVYDDGDHALFGRADAKAEDLAYFRKHEMNVENLAYKNPEPAPSTDKLPRATSLLDRPSATRGRANPHTLAAMRWLRPADAGANNAPFIPDPGRCILAIRDARRALHANPSESAAYLQLADAYTALLTQESALIAGIELTPANVTSIARVQPQPSVLADRYRQLVAALRYALLTTPPPQTTEERRELANLNLRLFQTYSGQGALDLARDNLDAWQKLAAPEDYQPEQYTALTRQLSALNNHLDEVQRAVTNMGIETQAGPVQKSMLARQRGAVGLAIQLLEEGLQSGINPAAIKPTLLDLYCEVGEPDKAGELWTSGNAADQVLSDGPGTAALRQGRVFLLLGNYDSALAVWAREAIPSLRGQRTYSVPMATRALLDGEPDRTTRMLLEIPDEVTRQAVWEFEAGVASLEAGHAVDETASHLTNALKLAPRLTVRPVIAYYLKKLGRPVPELPAETPKAEPAKAETKGTAPATAPAAAPAAAGAPK
jgi:hypothetical protein